MRVSKAAAATIVVGTMIAGLLIGCGGAPRTTEETSMVPMSSADTKATKNGVTVEVTPINNTNAPLYPILACEYSYMKKGLFGEEKAKARLASVLPGATFALKISNNTDHIIKMAGSDIGLSIAGQDVTQMNKEQVKQSWAAGFTSKGQFFPPEIVLAVDGVPFWDEDARVLPGKSMTVFSTFNVAITKGFSQSTMAIYDLVTNTDAAGNPTERTNFDFNFKELTTAITSK